MSRAPGLMLAGALRLTTAGAVLETVHILGVHDGAYQFSYIVRIEDSLGMEPQLESHATMYSTTE